MTKHPCQDKCPNFIDEQCCHCLIRETENISSDEEKFLNEALQAMEYIS